MRRLLIVLLLAPLAAFAAGPMTKTLIDRGGSRLIGSAASSSVVARYAFDRTGVPIPHNVGGTTATNVKQHLIWNGTTVVDLAPTPAALTEVGTVPMVSGAAGSTPWFPNGFATTGKPGAGPFSGSNYYQLPANSIYDTTGDFIICAVFDGQPVTAATQRIVSDYVVNTSGWSMNITTAGSVQMLFDSPAAAGVITANVGVNGLNVVCGGRATTTGWVKLNLGTAATGALPAQVAATTTQARIGLNLAGAQATTVTLRELIFWSGETPTDAKLIAIQKHVFGMYGTRGVDLQPVTFVRATTATCPLPYENQAVWLLPVGIPCISGGARANAGKDGGIRSGPLRVNSAQQSENSCAAGAVVAPWTLTGSPTCVADQQSGPWMFSTNTMDEWTSVANTDEILQPATLANTAVAVMSVWGAKASGTGTITVATRCTGGTATACTCWTSDGSACSAATSTTDCIAKATAVGTTPVRIAALGTCAAATTTWVGVMNPGDLGVATGVARLGGAQLEGGPVLTSYIPTAGAAVQRNGDQVSVVNALAATNPNTFCVAGTVAPAYEHPWAQVGLSTYIFTGGVPATANSWRTRFDTGLASGTSFVYDATGAARARNWAAASWTNGQHAHAFCAQAPTVNPYLDGVAIGTTQVTTGTGIVTTQPASVFLGADATGTSQIEGYVRNFRLCNSGDFSRCN